MNGKDRPRRVSQESFKAVSEEETAAAAEQHQAPPLKAAACYVVIS